MNGPLLFSFNKALFNISTISAKRSSDKKPAKQLLLSTIVNIVLDEISKS